MNLLIGMLLPAAALSALSAVCLALLPSAPPRTRLVVALAGLAVWAIPWPLLSIPLTLPGAAAIAELGGAFAPLPLSQVRGFEVAPAAGSRPTLYLAIALLLPTLAGLSRDGLSFTRCARAWKKNSRPADALRDLLPAELRRVRAEIRLVEGSRVAAASGFIRPTVWIGDAFSPRELQLALVHEFCHVRRADPATLMLINAVRRLYWWNPLAAYLSKQAVLMLESACDHECATLLGKNTYVSGLATIVLGSAPRVAPRLMTAANGGRFNLRRLELLRGNLRLHLRDRVLIAASAVAAVSFALYCIADPALLKPHWSRVVIPGTAAGSALATLLDAVDEHNVELMRIYLGAYTPQEIDSRPFERLSGGFELLDVVAADDRSIDFVVRQRGSRAIRHGRLEVADAAAAFRIERAAWLDDSPAGADPAGRR